EGKVSSVSAEWVNNYTVRLHVTTPAATTLIARITNMPGWQATVNGHEVPLHPWNLGMQQVTVSAGASTVTLTYWPPLFTLGLRLAAVAGAGLALWWALPGVVAGFRRRRQRQRLQRQTSLGGQPEEDLADAVGIP